MFQYAMGRSVSIQKNTPLYLDTSDFSNYRLHNGFELHRVFDADMNIAHKETLKTVLGWRYPSLVRRLLSRKSMSHMRGSRLVHEPNFEYWNGIELVSDNCYLSGYWQSERYFKTAANVIRKDFIFKRPLEGKNIQIAKLIRKVNAVSLHVRRGDYISNPGNSKVYDMCSLDYYNRAIKYIKDRVVDSHLFIFSDDIDWVRLNLKVDLPCVHVVHNEGEESYNDMHLMSLCQHHIIANSSFSWWGAWLNPRNDKIVVAPKKWFAKRVNTVDLLPNNWVRL